MLLPIWTYLGLLAILIGALGTLFDKYLLERYFGDHESDGAGPGALMIFSSYFAIFVVAFVFFSNYKNISFDFSTGLIGIAAGVLYGVWILLYLQAIHRSELSKTIPILQTIPAFSLIIAYITLGEKLLPLQIFAVGIIILGALVLLYIRGHSLLQLDYRTLIIILSAAFFTAVSDTIFKLVALNSNYVSAVFWSWSGFIIFGALLYLFIDDYQQQFEHLISKRIGNVFTANSINEIFDNVSELVFFAAIILGPIALVHTINAYEPLFILVLSILVTLLMPKYFNEDISAQSLIQKCAGISVITVGSYILYTTL